MVQSAVLIPELVHGYLANKNHSLFIQPLEPYILVR